MTQEHRPVAAAQVRELREAGRQQARTISAGFAVAVGVAVAAFAVVILVMLDYRFGMAPHRLVKIGLGVGTFALILLRPKAGLYLLPVLTPFLPWLPPLRLPGINPLNVILGSVFLVWSIGRVMERKSVFRSGRLSWTLGAVIGLAILSLVRGAAFPTGYTYNIPESAVTLFRSVVTLSLYFVALAMARGQLDRRILTWSVVLALLAESACTILYGRNGKGSRALGSIGQSN